MSTVRIGNDMPWAVTFHFDGPSKTSLTLPACEDCTVLRGSGSSCRSQRERTTPATGFAYRQWDEIRLMPGIYYVTAVMNTEEQRSYAGQWTPGAGQRLHNVLLHRHLLTACPSAETLRLLFRLIGCKGL